MGRQKGGQTFADPDYISRQWPTLVDKLYLLYEGIGEYSSLIYCRFILLNIQADCVWDEVTCYCAGLFRDLLTMK